jgi:hypothetical protein
MNKALFQELKLLRSLAISIVGKDSEGKYKPAYVRRILEASRKKPTKEFISEKEFLAELERI